ncbi:MAG: hypothetical protein E4H26_09730 [Flavobacteriales bacterium]|nr:MAG: hypothetical protein E4H26_09730 [Flavobacteriales bacterium]
MTNYGKKFVTPLLALLILIGSSGCNPKVDREMPEAVSVKAPNQIIEIDEAKSFYDDYTLRRVPLIQKYEDSINQGRATGTKQQMQQNTDNEKATAAGVAEGAKFDVARYVYYDYATLKQYMAYLEQEAKLANVEISTMRLYFSNYPDDSKYVHPRQNSIMLSPTVKRGDRDYLFYIGELDGKAEAVLLNNDFGPMQPSGMGNASTQDGKSHASFVPSLGTTHPNAAVLIQEGKSLTLNRGNGVPPPYN